MSVIHVHDKQFHPFLSPAQIQDRVASIAAMLNKDYAGKKPLFIAVLNGSFMFAADLFKRLTIETEICFIKLASYKGSRSTGHVITAIGLDNDIIGRDIVIIEDIVDTGKTMHEFLPQLYHQQPSSVRIATLLHKSEATVFPVRIDYLGFDIPDKFVVGYGLDYDGLGRNIPGIYKLAE